MPKGFFHNVLKLLRMNWVPCKNREGLGFSKWGWLTRVIAGEHGIWEGTLKWSVVLTDDLLVDSVSLEVTSSYRRHVYDAKCANNDVNGSM
jgi:hypothetical protein